MVAPGHRRGHVSPEFRLRPSLSGDPPGAARPTAQVSPEFRLRPSLSGVSSVDCRPGVPRVAGVQTPAFVERASETRRSSSTRTCVAGVQTPAFVERSSPRRWRRSSSRAVSPEFRLRPSLSVVPPDLVDGGFRPRARVAGVQTPAFVERPHALALRWEPSSGVSPEFRLRPSLSGDGVPAPSTTVSLGVSPEFRLRPSLSARHVWRGACPRMMARCRRSSDSGLR